MFFSDIKYFYYQAYIFFLQGITTLVTASLGTSRHPPATGRSLPPAAEVRLEAEAGRVS